MSRTTSGPSYYENELGPLNRDTFSADIARRTTTCVWFNWDTGEAVDYTSQTDTVIPPDRDRLCADKCVTLKDTQVPLPDHIKSQVTLTRAQMNGAHTDGKPLTRPELQGFYEKLRLLHLWSTGLGISNISAPGKSRECRTRNMRHKIALLGPIAVETFQERSPPGTGTGWSGSRMTRPRAYDSTMQPLGSRKVLYDTEWNSVTPTGQTTRSVKYTLFWGEPDAQESPIPRDMSDKDILSLHTAPRAGLLPVTPSSSAVPGLTPDMSSAASLLESSPASSALSPYYGRNVEPFAPVLHLTPEMEEMESELIR